MTLSKVIFDRIVVAFVVVYGLGGVESKRAITEINLSRIFLKKVIFAWIHSSAVVSVESTNQQHITK